MFNWGFQGGAATLALDFAGEFEDMLNIYTLTTSFDTALTDLFSDMGPTEKYVSVADVLFETLEIPSEVLQVCGVSLSLQYRTKFDVALEGDGVVLLDQDALIHRLGIQPSTTLEFDGARSLTIDEHFDNAATIIMAEGSSLTSPTSLSNTGTIEGAGTIAPPVLNSETGTVHVHSGTLRLTGGLINDGAVLVGEWGKLPVPNWELENNGTITIAGMGSTLKLGTWSWLEAGQNDVASITGSGTIEVGDGGLLEMDALYNDQPYPRHSSVRSEVHNDVTIQEGGRLLSYGVGFGSIPAPDNTLDGALMNLGTFDIDGNLTTGVTGPVHSGGTLSVTGWATLDAEMGLTNEGQISLNMGTLKGGEVQNRGEVTGTAGTIESSFHNEVGGVVTADVQPFDDRPLVFSGELVVNDGIMQAANGGTLEIGADASFANTGTVSAFGGGYFKASASSVTNIQGNELAGGRWTAAADSCLAIANTSIVQNRAAVELVGANSRFDAINTITVNHGSFTITDGRNFTSVGKWDNYGELTVGASSTFTITPGYELNNYGQINGTGTIAASFGNGGVLSPGNSPGTLFVDGDYSQTESGRLIIEIGGFDEGTYDVLHITGHATLAGALDVVLWDDFVPNRDGWTYHFLTFDSCQGYFDSCTGLNFAPWGYFEVIYADTCIGLVTHMSDPMAVPTPGAAVLCLLGMGTAFWRGKTRGSIWS